MKPFIVAVTSLFLLCAGYANAQTPSVNSLLLKAATPTPKKVDAITADGGSSKERLAKTVAQQTDTQKQLDAATVEINKAKNAAAALPANASDYQRQAAAQLESALQTRIDFLSQTNDLLKELERQILNTMTAESDRDNWKPPAGTPPWPLATGDEALIITQQLNAQINKQTRKLGILDEDIVAQKKRRAQAEVDLRQVMGLVSNSKSFSEADLAVRQDIERAKTKLDLFDLELTRTDVERLIILQMRRLLYVQLSAAQQTWDYYQNRFAFTQQDLDNRLADIDKKISALRAKEQETSTRLNQVVALAKSTKTRLTAMEGRTNAVASDIAQAKKAWLNADSAASGVRTERAKYRALIELELLSKQIWTLRQQVHVKDNLSANVKTLQARLVEYSRKLDQGIQYLREIIEETNQTLVGLKEQRLNAENFSDRAFYDGLIQQSSTRIEDLRSVDAQTDRVKQLLGIATIEVDRAARSLSFWENARNVGTTVSDAFQTVWRYELIAVDDTAIVDGREIKTKRSVTVGKSVGALAILFIGFSLISKIIRRSLALAVSKAGLTASRSVVVGRWLTLGAGITLVICAFNLVEIPLSAFAFFGGALAIGVGFGTQNLLKNLFSGVMLLIEKSIRIGDVVEIDNITGTVTSIGIRFSTIQSAHGTDNLIPNSVLVEQKLVNWTYSTPDVRREIQVTVAYGTNAKDVINLLIKVCAEHEGVLENPAPVATLLDFGDRGLVFSVQLWIRLTPSTSLMATLGSVRLAILESFTQAGIKLPFPHYVVQLEKND